MPMLLASESGGVSPVMSVLRSPWGILLCWLLVINLVTFLVFGLDKWKAKRKEKRESVRRVPERTLFLLSAIGGSVGALLGMRVFHHKTLHRSFRIGVPVLSLLWTAVTVALIWKTAL